LAVSAGDAYLDVHSRLAAGFGRDMARQVQTPAGRAGEEASRHFGRRFAAGLKTAGAVIGTGLAGAAVLATRGINASVKAASDLNETLNKTRVVFGPASKQVLAFGANSARALGQSRQQALEATATFGNLFVSMKIGQKPAADMSMRMVKLASDLASFNNVKPEEALEALRSGLVGETEPLRRFGVNLNAAAIEAEAMRLGLVKVTRDTPKLRAAQVAVTAAQRAYNAAVKDHGPKSLEAQKASAALGLAQQRLQKAMKGSTSELGPAAKAQAAYSLILKQTTTAQGDFARTARDNANQQRIAKAQWEDLKATLGQGFLPAQLAVTRAFTEKLLPAGRAVAAEFGPRLGRAVTAAAQAFARSVPPATQLAETARTLGPRLDRLVPTGERLGAGLGQLVGRSRELRPQFQGLHGDTTRLATTWKLSGAALDFLGNHLDLVVKALPALVVGYGLVKAAQAAANVAAAAEIVLAPARIAANFALARSQRALTAALKEQAAMSGVATVAQGRLTVATGASTVATGAAVSRWRLLAGGIGRVLGPATAVIAVLAALKAEHDRYNRTQQKANELTGQQRELALRMVGPNQVLHRSVAAATAAWQDHNRRMVEAAAAQQRVTAQQHTGTGVVQRLGAGVSDATGRVVRHTAALARARVTSAATSIEFRRLVTQANNPGIDQSRNRVDRLTSGMGKAKVSATDATREMRRFVTQANTPSIDQGRGRVDRLTGGMGRSKVSATDAAREFRRFGTDAKAAVDKVRSKRVGVTAVADVDLTRRTIKLNNQFGGKVQLAEGGWVWGPGTAMSDSVRARLSRGEFVVNARSAARHRALLEQINEQRFAQGGPVLDARATVTPRFRNLGRLDDLAERLSTNVAGRTAKAVATKVADEILANLGGIGGGGTLPGATGSVNQIAQRTAGLLRRLGEWASWARRIMFESGGNWSAVNRWDSNWAAGHPSVGGAQVIRGTFARYAGPYRNVGPFLYGVSINPLANSYAGANYAVHRYGSLRAVDPRVRPRGYDSGGVLPPGLSLSWNGLGRPEPLVPPGAGGIDYDRLGHAVAAALRAEPPVMQFEDVRTAGKAWKRRSGGMPVGLG
jgi:hypothetical protein